MNVSILFGVAFMHSGLWSAARLQHVSSPQWIFVGNLTKYYFHGDSKPTEVDSLEIITATNYQIRKKHEDRVNSPYSMIIPTPCDDSALLHYCLPDTTIPCLPSHSPLTRNQHFVLLSVLYCTVSKHTTHIHMTYYRTYELFTLELCGVHTEFWFHN